MTKLLLDCDPGHDDALAILHGTAPLVPGGSATAERLPVTNPADRREVVGHWQPADAALVERALQGDKPAVAIAGDVQLAAEVAWLIDHVRWDLEDDLARLVGDAAAHTLVTWGRRLAQALRTQLLPRARALAERAAPRGGADPRATTTTPDGGAAA